MKSAGKSRVSSRVVVANRQDGADALELATQALINAEYVVCRRFVEFGSASARSRGAAAEYALVEARCARFQGDVEAWAAAADTAAQFHPDANARLEGLALRAHARLRSQRGAEAEADFERLERTLERDPEAMLGMPLYHLANRAWMRGDYDAADALVARNVEAGACVPLSLSMLGWSEMKRERFARAGSLFADVLANLKADGDVDVRLRAQMIQAASSVAGETGDLRLARKIRKEFDEFAWPESLAIERFHTLVALHYVALLEGDLEAAWTLAREAVVRAPSVGTEASGEIGFAAMSRLVGDDHAATFAFGRAWELLRKRRASSGDDETRAALAYFAAEAATEMPGEARKALALCESFGPREHASAARERRVRGAELLATARVAEAKGERERARVAYKHALDLWQTLRFDMRAAIVARDLRRLTRDRKYDSAIDVLLARAPKAWLGSHGSASHDVLEAITPAETLVLASLLEGKTARAIADDLDRSVHTVNNHTRKIFKAFGVTSRSGVLARCATYGITPKSLGRPG